MNRRYILYWYLHEIITIILSNNYFCPRTKYFQQNHQTTAQNQVVVFFCRSISIESDFCFFVPTSCNKLVFFLAWFYFIWKILDSILIFQFWCKKLWETPLEIIHSQKSMHVLQPIFIEHWVCKNIRTRDLLT